MAVGECTDSPVLEFHEIENVAAAPNEKEFHQRVVQRHPFAEEEVKVARNKYDDIEKLGFEGNTWTRKSEILTVEGKR